MLKDKGMIIGIVVTFLLIFGGVYFFSRGESATPETPSKFSDQILIPSSAYKSSGLVNGNYLPATDSAKLTLVEFGDFQCPACGLYHPLIKQLMQDMAGKINFVFRNFPLNQHANANISSYAAEAAGLQGKFWQMHDLLYETQKNWSDSNNAKEIFIGYAKTLGLNIEQFNKDIDSQAVKDKVKSDLNDGGLVKLTATPTYYLNGTKIENMPPSYDELKKLFTSELAK